MVFSMPSRPDIEKALVDFMASEHAMETFEMVSFAQKWGSTALGIKGRMGCRITTVANTTVFVTPEIAVVYFGAAYAYSVSMPSAIDTFVEDMAAHKMADTVQAPERYGRISVTRETRIKAVKHGAEWRVRAGESSYLCMQVCDLPVRTRWYWGDTNIVQAETEELAMALLEAAREAWGDRSVGKRGLLRRG